MEGCHEGGGDGNGTPATTSNVGGDAAAVFRKGAWSNEEDEKLRSAVEKYGLRNWVAVEKYSGLGRPAKNCRLRWLNYLRPNLKKYPFAQEEEELIFRLHSEYGNSWSRIASKLPGRSDNDIKNFWHKRSNKRRRHKLPHYQTTSENRTNPSNNGTTLLIHSPQTIAMSIPQHQFFSSPASSPHVQHQITDQTTLLPNTPTSSRTQNLLISPVTETPPFSAPDTPPNYITQQFSFRKPPILSSAPHGRFSRDLSPNSTYPPQMQFSSPMEPPRSPLKLNFSTDSQVPSFSAFQLHSPNSAPLSPLKLRLSIPVPSEFCFGSNPSIPDPTAQLSSSSCGQYFPPIQPTALDSCSIKTEPPSIQAESDSKFKIMKELREAEARVRFLKKKLKLKRISNKTSLQKKSSKTADLTGSSSDSITEECTSNTISGSENLINGISRAKKTTWEENRLRKGENSESQNYAHGESTELGKDYSLCEIFEREDSMTFHEQIDFSYHLNIPDTMSTPNNTICHFQGHAADSLNECSAMGGMYNEGSTLLRDSFIPGDNNNNNDDDYNMFVQRSNEPLRDAFGSINSQSTATTPGDNIGWSSYLQSDQDCYLGYGFGQEMSDNLEMNSLPSQDLIDSSCFVSAPKPPIMQQEYFRVEKFSFHQTPGGGRPDETNMLLHKSSSAPNLIDNPVDFRYLADFEQGCPTRDVPYLIQSCGGDEFDFDVGELTRECMSGKTWRQEPCREQSLMEGSMVDNNLWLEVVDLMESRQLE